MIKCAIIGLGRWGQLLVNSSKNSKLIKFTYGVTRTPSKVKDFCENHDILLADDYETILAGAHVDAVVLATPHTQHFDQIVKAAQAGKHVFCEKPYTLNRAQAIDALAAVTAAGVKTAVGLNLSLIHI